MLKRDMPYNCFIEVEYIPFLSEEKRREAYYIQAKLFLRAKERELRGKVNNHSQKVNTAAS